MKVSELDKNGYLKIEKFLSTEINNQIFGDIKKIFNGPDNIANGYQIVKKNYKRYKKNINFPFLINSKTNLLEIAIDAFNVLKDNSSVVKENYEFYKLTNFDIEEVRDKSLFMHTDNNKGMFRCFVLLNGTDLNSGSTRYVKGSQNRNFFVKHELDNETKIKNNYNEEIIQASPGDMVILDTYGFHGNTVQKKSRYALIFEFRNSRLGQPSNFIALTANNISKKVKENLKLFETKEEGSHGSYERVKNVPRHTNPKNIILSCLRYLINSIKVF
jgi:hypothetical protein